MKIEYGCFCQVQLVSPAGYPICKDDGSLDFTYINRIAPYYYTGVDCVVVSSEQDIIDHFAEHGHEIEIRDCVIYFDPPSQGQDCPPIYAETWPSTSLYSDIIEDVCSLGQIHFDKFIGLDLTQFGGSENTIVKNNQDIINAFSDLGFTASIDNCQIIIQGCTFYDPIKVVPNPKITIVGGCESDEFNYNLFDAIDLSFYGGKLTDVSNATDIVNAFLELGIEAIISHCEIELVNWYDEYQDLTACLYPRVHILTEDLLSTCLNNNIDYSLFDYINLTPWGGDWTYVNSDTELKNAFKALGITATISNCEIKLHKCGIASDDINSTSDPVIILEDTDENLGPLCIGVNYDFSKFKAIDLSFYGGSKQVAVNNITDVTTAIQNLMPPGVTVTRNGCEIKLNKYGYGKAYANIEVCNWKTIHLVDTDEGIHPCLNMEHDFGSFDQVDFTPYGGKLEFVYSNTDIITKIEKLIGKNKVSISGCEITIKDCTIDLFDLEVKQTLKPEALLDFTLGSNYEICFKALLIGTNGFQKPMDDGDHIQILIPSLGLNVKLIVGEDILTPSGYTDDFGTLSWVDVIPSFVQSSIVLDKDLLYDGTMCCNFNKFKLSYDLDTWGAGVKKGTDLSWTMKAIHGSDISLPSYAVMKKLWGSMMFDISMLHYFAHCGDRKKHSHAVDVNVTDFILPDDISLTKGFIKDTGDVRCDFNPYNTEIMVTNPLNTDGMALCSGCACDVEGFMTSDCKIDLQNWSSLPQILPAGLQLKSKFQMFQSAGGSCFPHPHAVINEIDTNPADRTKAKFSVKFGVHSRFPARTDNANIKEDRYWVGLNPGDSASSGVNRVVYKWTSVNNTEPNPQYFTGPEHLFPKEGIYNLYGEIELVTGVVDTWENEYICIYSY